MKTAAKALTQRIFGRRGYDMLRSGIRLISRREYRAVLEDLDTCLQAASAPSLQRTEHLKATLRQLAHMLDKSCLRDDFEPGHATEVYSRAQTLIKQLDASPDTTDPTVEWAKEIIAIYETMQNDPTVRPAPRTIPKSPPYDLAVSLMKSRQSVRSFLSRPVDASIAEQAAQAGLWAPSSCNRQTPRIYATVNPETARECLRQCIGGTGFSTFIPSFFSFAADIRSYQLPAECLTVQVDVALAAQNCALAAASLGLSMTMLTWASHTPKANAKLHELLGIPEHNLIVLNAVAGYPASPRGHYPTRLPPAVACYIIE